jgi:putative tricarboxylic transport membrane protein
VLADVPTWTEHGLKVVVSNSRSVTGPRGMTEAQVAWWDQALRKLIESEEWEKEFERNFRTTEYLSSADTRKLFEEEHVRLREFLTELGLARQ